MATTTSNPSGVASASMQPAAESTFSQAQLDQMMAPIALYPDALLSQVLMAATYPAEVADAARWSKTHSKESGDAAVKAVQSESWDASVKSLVAFPQVIQMMGDKPDWVQNLGDAFLASSRQVLDAAQRLRARAKANGSLESSPQQTVTVQTTETQQSAIAITPANPQVVYVPAYNPAVVYGAWPYPAYPPFYWPAYYPGYYPGAALATGIAFGVGFAATAALWGGCNWGRGDVNINVDRYNSINVNQRLSANQTTFQHNAASRRGVPYRDSASQQQFGKNLQGAPQRSDYRGRADQSRDFQRQQAESALRQRGFSGGEGGMSRGDAFGGGGFRGDHAFRGAGGGDQMQQFDRGFASRESMGGGFEGGGGRFGGGGFGGGGRFGGGGFGGGRR
ncbi:DUF3300 domain-containing protein [Variovorax sp. J22R133]|uniref:DUF3300 domain-containing protein n=1 Tax=Variovorax brevis TaxID=3053503 RepID=UPI0025754F96|nr:DUF3300 domain-containing protein [Variovorax sp. J22R133]MDM0117944.1 DUF3300 domain-containing protein [Variovorax sp. J22R133]